MVNKVRNLIYSRVDQVRRRDRALLAAARLFEGASVLEPGGPSVLFGAGGLVPVYPRLAALDTLDYAEQTIWSDAGHATDRAIRRRLIGEAGHLEQVQDDVYDAVFASHILEHLGNPLGALAEWQRVVRPGGHVLMIVPHREGTFDHRRPITSIEHLKHDAERNTGEDDPTHLDEILRLHDLERDPGCPDRETFERRCRDFYITRSIHHHVFDSLSVVRTCQAAGLEVLMLRPKLPCDIVCLCRVGGASDGGLSERALSAALRWSPFASDRAAGTRGSERLAAARA